VPVKETVPEVPVPSDRDPDRNGNERRKARDAAVPVVRSLHIEERNMTHRKSNIETGTGIEKLAEASLRADGWKVHRTRRAKFDTNDLWGVFDIAAIAPKNGSLLLVQTTDPTNATHRKRKVEEWARPIYDPVEWQQGPVIQVWAYGKWPDGVGFRIWSYVGGRDWVRTSATRPVAASPSP
jgi:hypothetical protein